MINPLTSQSAAPSLRIYLSICPIIRSPPDLRSSCMVRYQMVVRGISRGGGPSSDRDHQDGGLKKGCGYHSVSHWAQNRAACCSPTDVCVYSHEGVWNQWHIGRVYYHKLFCRAQEISPHLFFRHPRGRCDRRDAGGPNRPTQQSSKEEEASTEKSHKEEKERAGVWTVSPVWCVEWTTVSIFPLYGSNIDVCRCFDPKIFLNWAEM